MQRFLRIWCGVSRPAGVVTEDGTACCRLERVGLGWVVFISPTMCIPGDRKHPLPLEREARGAVSVF